MACVDPSAYDALFTFYTCNSTHLSTTNAGYLGQNWPFPRSFCSIHTEYSSCICLKSLLYFILLLGQFWFFWLVLRQLELALNFACSAFPSKKLGFQMCTTVPESLVNLGFEGFFKHLFICLGVCMCVTAHVKVGRQHVASHYVYTGIEHKLLGLAGNTFN